MSESAAPYRFDSHGVAMPKLADILRLAESLEPDDRLRLIVRLWATLPPEHWAAPTASELAEVERRLKVHSAMPAVDPPWEVVRQMLFEYFPDRSKTPAAKIYSAPRRFDLATVFIATTAYCFLFAGLTLLDVWPVIKLYIGALITLVGVGQALFINFLDPRRASILVGASVHTIFSIVLFAIDDDYFFGSLIFAVLFNGILAGALFGYLAGVLAAGVFLVADVLRGKFELNRPAEEPHHANGDPSIDVEQSAPVLTSRCN